MSFHLLSSPALLDAVDASFIRQPVVSLAAAAICLVVVVRFVKRALAPVGAFVRAVAAGLIVASAGMLALTMLAVAALMSAP